MARLLSLNVGMPKDVPWQGRTVHTGIFKYPVEGPRLVRKLNGDGDGDGDGDGQGDLNGHGGEMRAVLVYQSESYAFWQRRLGRDDLEFGAPVRGEQARRVQARQKARHERVAGAEVSATGTAGAGRPPEVRARHPSGPRDCWVAATRQA